MLLLNNARPHVSVSMLQKLKDFGWDVLNQPPYSPVMEATDSLFTVAETLLLWNKFCQFEQYQKSPIHFLYIEAIEGLENGH